MTKKNRLLIVDDEQSNTHILEEILSFYSNYEYKVAYSGEEALSILKNYTPDIVLLDIMMPGIDGLEVCKRIRNNEKLKFLKIIMISGLTSITDRLKGYEVGADDYITKPFVEDELIAKLKVYSKLSRMEEVDTLKTTALNIINHETRTPLNGIILGSELLLDMEELPEKALDYVKMVRDSGERIKGLVDKITQYFSLKEGVKKNLTSELLTDVFSDLQKSIFENHNNKITFNCTENVSGVADWNLIKEAVTYLVTNALKQYPKQEVVIDCRSENGSLYIEIEDLGDGIDPLFVEKIFDGLFVPDVLNLQQGTGLSLAIAKEIIENHDGQITYRQNDKEKPFFEVIIPLIF